LVLLSQLLQRKFGKNPSQDDPGKRILGFCYRYHEVQTLKRGISSQALLHILHPKTPSRKEEYQRYGGRDEDKQAYPDSETDSGRWKP
jgi:hypothetical protein